MPPATSQDGATAYTLHESAQLLGVSLGTIRRKIARGELRAERVHRPQGHVWQVWLEPAQDAADPPMQPPAGTVPQNPAQPPVSMLATDRGEQLALALAPLVEASVNAAVAPLRAELADVRALLSARDQELGAALERIRALEAPKELTPQERPFLGGSEGVSVEPTQTPSKPPQRGPWWMPWRRVTS